MCRKESLKGWIEIMIFKSDKEKAFTKEEAINLMVSLSATDANSEKKWKGFYISLSQAEFQAERNEYWQP
tara:strand:- start:327 stop:536 length:210 start_codon:yes stop_codon:yes gene_type:complete